MGKLGRPLVVLTVAFACGGFWAANAGAATFTVTNTKDTGAGSLRDAITKANATPLVADTIKFAIPFNGYYGVNFHTISVTDPSGLPAITSPVTIDGTSQPGYAGAPLIRIDNGCSCPYGLQVAALHTKILGLSITHFSSYGVDLYPTSGDDTIAGDWIGLDQFGSPSGNEWGVLIGSGGNLIGGTTLAARNVISGNIGRGISIYVGKNVVAGNFIGLAPDGRSAEPNGGEGIDINSSAAGNVIGGTTLAARNVISGNATGVELTNGANGNVLQGNYIGTDATGTLAVGNAGAGVSINGGATGNRIGGISAAARNVISGNDTDGVVVTDTGTNSNVVAGNYIGMTADGTAALGNLQYGIRVTNSASNNTIGGSGAGNVIVANRLGGMLLSDSGTTANVVAGNLIGLTRTGAAIPNGCNGIQIFSASANTIGGTTPLARNVISGNGTASGCGGNGSGIEVDSATSNTIAGNEIGTNIAGTAALGNRATGISLYSSLYNVIGGTTPGARNIISGNGRSGILVFGSSNNTVKGNFIGTNATGTAPVANGGDGVDIRSGSTNNTVGGLVVGARNLISGNGEDGVAIADAATGGNTVEGNYVGTNPAGSVAIPNECNGVSVVNASGSNTIGGLQMGSRNVISGNGLPGSSCGGFTFGVYVEQSVSTYIQGNYIGTTASGSAALGNLGGGVAVDYDGGTSNTTTIGGTSPGARNVISGNRDDGIDIVGAGHDAKILNNFIGTNAAGTGPLGNINNGIYVSSTGANNSVGDVVGDGNVIAFNGLTSHLDGVRVDGATGVTISGNSIFTNGLRGIDLVNHGNHDQPSATITSVTTGGTSTTIDGTFPAAPGDSYAVELFGSAACDPTGGGKISLGFATVTNDGSGTGTFHAVLTPALTASKKVVTALVTDTTTDDTSEFSGCKS